VVEPTPADAVRVDGAMMRHDDVPRLSDVRARLARAMGVMMSTPIVPERLLDLSDRASAADRELVPGTSVWYRDDVRLDDRASRVVAATFVGYSWRHRRCAIVPLATDERERPRWVPPTDVLVRHWGDDADVTRPRMALAPIVDDTMPRAAGLVVLLVGVAAFAALVSFVAWVTR